MPHSTFDPVMRDLDRYLSRSDEYDEGPVLSAEDEDYISDTATDRFFGCGYDLAWSLNNDLITDDVSVTDVAKVTRGGYDPHGKPAHELLAVIINCSDAKSVKEAAFELREQIRQHKNTKQRIADIAAEIRKEFV